MGKKKKRKTKKKLVLHFNYIGDFLFFCLLKGFLSKLTCFQAAACGKDTSRELPGSSDEGLCEGSGFLRARGTRRPSQAELDKSSQYGFCEFLVVFTFKIYMYIYRIIYIYRYLKITIHSFWTNKVGLLNPFDDHF